MSDRSRTPFRHRGIRSGSSARRKRLACVNWNLPQNEIPVAHGNSVHCFLQRLGSRSQATTKLIRLSILRILWLTLQGLCLSQLQITFFFPRPKGVAKSSSSSSRPSVAFGPPAKASQVTISRSNPLLGAVPKGEAASSSKGSATPKFSAASSSKGSVLLNQLRSQSLKGRYDRNLRKRVLHLKAL